MKLAWLAYLRKFSVSREKYQVLEYELERYRVLGSESD